MAGSTGRIPAIWKIFAGSDHESEFSGGSASLDDMVFGFLEEGEGSPESCCTNDDGDEDDENDQNSGDVAGNKVFWETQNQLLQTTLSRNSSLESRIRRATKEALRESQLSESFCVCRKLVAGGCRNCLLRDVSDRLRVAGFNCKICKSKWRSSENIPAGEHTYLDVVDKSNPMKGEVRVIIELNFRAEFEMARASEEYTQLVNRLPEIFAGKAEKLRTLIKILCSGAKKCMKEKKMHMGPWRKHKYMQAKWFGTCELTLSDIISPAGFSGRQRKPMASLLTFDLVEKLHCTAVAVV